MDLPTSWPSIGEAGETDELADESLAAAESAMQDDGPGSLAKENHESQRFYDYSLVMSK